MNFLSYTFLGLILIERIMNDYMGRPVYRQDVDRDELSPIFFLEIYIFISTLIVVLGLFSTFHWFLVLKGKTTLECCLNDERYTPSKSWSENLKIVFGTSNIILIFMPNISFLKIKGYSWGNIQQEGN